MKADLSDSGELDYEGLVPSGLRENQSIQASSIILSLSASMSMSR